MIGKHNSHDTVPNCEHWGFSKVLFKDTFIRGFPVDRVMDIVRLAERYRDCGVVGVDIAGDELLRLDPRHVAGFKRAKELGLHVTVHAAESGPAFNVKQAVEEMGADRIGHGYHVLDDKAIYQFAKDRKLHFEVSSIIVVFL